MGHCYIITVLGHLKDSWKRNMIENSQSLLHKQKDIQINPQFHIIIQPIKKYLIFTLLYETNTASGSPSVNANTDIAINIAN